MSNSIRIGVGADGKDVDLHTLGTLNLWGAGESAHEECLRQIAYQAIQSGVGLVVVTARPSAIFHLLYSAAERADRAAGMAIAVGTTEPSPRQVEDLVADQGILFYQMTDYEPESMQRLLRFLSMYEEAASAASQHDVSNGLPLVVVNGVGQDENVPVQESAANARALLDIGASEGIQFVVSSQAQLRDADTWLHLHPTFLGTATITRNAHVTHDYGRTKYVAQDIDLAYQPMRFVPEYPRVGRWPGNDDVASRAA